MAPFDLGDLPDYRADGAGGRGNHDGLPGLRLSDFEQTDIGGHPRHAEYAKRCGDRSRFRVELAQACAIRERIFLPSTVAEDEVANRVFRIVGGDDLPDRAAHHRPPNRNRWRIRSCRIHTTAHIWVEREIEGAHQHLAVAGLRRRRFRQLEIVEVGCAFGSALQQDLAVDAAGHQYSPSRQRVWDCQCNEVYYLRTRCVDERSIAVPNEHEDANPPQTQIAIGNPVVSNGTALGRL